MTAPDLSFEELERIVAACNSAIWFLQVGHGDEPSTPSPRLDDAPEWAVESTWESVRAVLSGVTMEQLWQNWCASKYAAGWTYGPVKDAIAKTHPCLVGSYDDLPDYEKFKDRVFTGLVQLARDGQLYAKRGES